jgi:glycosyltransferase involved in cell wall biosynthesis
LAPASNSFEKVNMMLKTDVTRNAVFGAEGTRPPVILQILPALNSGGVEQGVIDINAAIVKAGGRSLVVSRGGARVSEIEAAGGRHVALPVHSKNPLVIAANVGRLRKVIRDEQVDIVHSCSRAPAWSAVRAVQETKARYITSCHAAHSISGKLKRFYNSSISRGELVIAVSNFVADYLAQNYGVDRGILRVIHRGVAVEKFNPDRVSAEQVKSMASLLRIPEGARVILLPARFSRTKGHQFLLDAFKKMQRPDAVCVFLGSDIGNEKYRKDLESYISSIGLDSQVRIASGYDMPAAYLLASVVVAPSMTPEGFGRVPIEAQAMGRPVITTDHGGMRETVKPGETGWLVPPGDVGCLAEALNHALNLSEQTRSEMGARAVAHVTANFTNECMCKATLDVYGELLQKSDPVKKAA